MIESFEQIYQRAFSTLSKIFPSTPSKNPSKNKPQKKVKQKMRQRKKVERNIRQQNKDIFMLLQRKSVEEIARDIREARNKAWNGEALSSYESFLFDTFLSMGNGSIEELAKKLKESIKKVNK